MTISEYVDALNAKFPNSNHLFSFRQGTKYAKVVREGSAYCFIDADGNIFKAATWATPAKGIRANLNTLDMSKVDQFGGWLYR